MCKDIADKKAIDYVGSYELIKHDKLKKECFAADKAADGERGPKGSKAMLAADTEAFYSIDNPASWKGTSKTQGQDAVGSDGRGGKDLRNSRQLAKRDTGGQKYMSKEQVDRLKRFHRRYKKADTLQRPEKSPQQKLQTAQKNNFMEEAKEQPGANRDMDNTEMIFDDSQAHLVGRSKYGYDLGDQKAQSKPSAIVHNQPRFKTFQSLGFQGNPQVALYLICDSLRKLDFVSIQFEPNVTVIFHRSGKS